MARWKTPQASNACRNFITWRVNKIYESRTGFI